MGRLLLSFPEREACLHAQGAKGKRSGVCNTCFARKFCYLRFSSCIQSLEIYDYSIYEQSPKNSVMFE